MDDLLSSAYAAERRALIGDRAATRPAARLTRRAPAPAPRLRHRRGPPHHRDGRARHRRAHRGLSRHHPRRHRPRRRRRSLGQHRLGHPVRRLAAELARRPRSRLRARHPRADVLARARAAQLAGPGKRPRTTLTPSLALRGGVPALAFGTPGGDQQEQWQLCFWLAHADRGLDLQAAIDAPAWHTTSFPSSFYPREMTSAEVVVESRIGDDVIAGLRRRGHAVTVAGPWSLGRLSAVSRDPETGMLRAAANPRGMSGYAAGR